MTRINKITKCFLSATLLVGAIGMQSCISSSRYSSEQYLEERLQQGRPLIVTIEGVQIPPQNNCEQFGKGLAKEYNLTQRASIGNWWCHLEYIQKAKKNNDKIILVGHSAGTDQIRLLAHAFKKTGRINLMIYHDPTYTNLPMASLLKIPSNVDRVIAFYSDDCLLSGRPLQDIDFEDPRKTSYTNFRIYRADHWQIVLDSRVHGYASSEIQGVLAVHN